MTSPSTTVIINFSTTVATITMSGPIIIILIIIIIIIMVKVWAHYSNTMVILGIFTVLMVLVIVGMIFINISNNIIGISYSVSYIVDDSSHGATRYKRK